MLNFKADEKLLLSLKIILTMQPKRITQQINYVRCISIVIYFSKVNGELLHFYTFVF